SCETNYSTFSVHIARLHEVGADRPNFKEARLASVLRNSDQCFVAPLGLMKNPGVAGELTGQLHEGPHSPRAADAQMLCNALLYYRENCETLREGTLNRFFCYARVSVDINCCVEIFESGKQREPLVVIGDCTTPLAGRRQPFEI